MISIKTICENIILKHYYITASYRKLLKYRTADAYIHSFVQDWKSRFRNDIYSSPRVQYKLLRDCTTFLNTLDGTNHSDLEISTTYFKKLIKTTYKIHFKFSTKTAKSQIQNEFKEKTIAHIKEQIEIAPEHLKPVYASLLQMGPNSFAYSKEENK